MKRTNSYSLKKSFAVRLIALFTLSMMMVLSMPISVMADTEPDLPNLVGVTEPYFDGIKGSFTDDGNGNFTATYYVKDVDGALRTLPKFEIANVSRVMFPIGITSTIGSGRSYSTSLVRESAGDKGDIFAISSVGGGVNITWPANDREGIVKFELYYNEDFVNYPIGTYTIKLTEEEPLPDPAKLVGIDSMTASWFTFNKNNVVNDGNGNLSLNVDALANLGGIAFQRIVFAVDNVPENATIVCEAGWRYSDGRDDFWPNQNERNLTPQGGNLFMSPHNNTNLTKSNINDVSAIYRLSIGGEIIGTFVIQYTAAKFNVTYDADNGSEPVVITVNGGTQLSEPTRPVKEGHTFKGWYLNGKAFTFGVVFGDYVVSDITLKANWDVNMYTVTFMIDDIKYSEEKVAYNNIVAEPATPEMEGYEFVRWEINGEAYDFDTPVKGNFTLNAAWEKVIVVSAESSAFVTKLNGNKNDLTITIIEKMSNGTVNKTTKTFSIENNTAGIYNIDDYKVYVDTKGNDQIRACYIVD